VPELFYEILQLGQWSHLGKNATFGLGRYTLEAPCKRAGQALG
jgi:hypothetical protein